MSDGPDSPERQGVHSDEELAALRSPIVAAWDVGRLLNVLAFHMQQDWLLSGQLGQQERVSLAFDDLVLAARKLLPNVAAQDELKDRLCDWHEGWSEYIQSEQHDELLISANHEITDEANQEGLDSRSVAQRKVEELVESVQYEVGKARNLLEGSLEERQLKAFRLAEAIDQIARPQDAYVDMYLAAETVVNRSTGSEESAVNDRQHKRRTRVRIVMGRRRINELPDAWHLPRHTLDHTMRTPADRQTQEIALRWRQLELPAEELKSITRAEAGSQAERLLDRGRHALLTADLIPAGTNGRSQLGDSPRTAAGNDQKRKKRRNQRDDIIEILRDAGHRMTGEEILAALEIRNGTASSGTIKIYLASMVGCGSLTNRKDVEPPGYGLPEWDPA